MRRLTRAESKARTRAKLLKAGSDLFAKRGFNAVTVETIVERAGFTRGAFYANFTDKADLFLELLEDKRDADMGRATSVVEATPDEQKLDAIQGWYDELIKTNRWGRAYAEFLPHASRDPAMRARLAARYAAQRAAIAGILAQYREAEGLELPVADDVVASLLLALGDGLANQRHLDQAAVPADAFTIGMALVWWGLGAEEAAEVLGSS